MKVRAFPAGEGRPPDIIEETNPPHEREGDKFPKVRAFPAGEDPIGSLGVVIPALAPTYFCPEGSPGAHARVLQHGTIVTILRIGDATKARGDRAAMVLTPDGDVGWVWLAQLSPA